MQQWLGINSHVLLSSAIARRFGSSLENYRERFTGAEENAQLP